MWGRIKVSDRTVLSEQQTGQSSKLQIFQPQAAPDGCPVFIAANLGEVDVLEFTTTGILACPQK